MMHTFTLSRGKQKQMDLWNLRRQKKDLRNWGGGNARNGTQGLSHARQALSHSATFQLLFFYNLFREGSQYAVQAALELMLQVGEALNFSSSLRDPLGSIIDLSHQACLLFFFLKEKKNRREENVTPTSNDKKGTQFSLLSTDFLITTPWHPVLTLQTGKCSGVS